MPWTRPLTRAVEAARLSEAHPGAVTFIQRFDSALRLNPHSHSEALDGVVVQQASELVFRRLGEPSVEDIEQVARRTFERAKRLLRTSRYGGHRTELDPVTEPV